MVRFFNLFSRKSLRVTGIAELGFVATLLGNVPGGTPTAGTELGTELGFVAALLGIVLGDTPMAGTELGTELDSVADTPTFKTVSIPTFNIIKKNSDNNDDNNLIMIINMTIMIIIMIAV